eukprot:2716280-Rhodomonas_salina.1
MRGPSDAPSGSGAEAAERRTSTSSSSFTSHASTASSTSSPSRDSELTVCVGPYHGCSAGVSCSEPGTRCEGSRGWTAAMAGGCRTVT